MDMRLAGQVVRHVLPWGLVVAVFVAPVPEVLAHEGHEHPETAPAVHGPRRLPDGTVFFPKRTQELLGIRAIPIREERLSTVIELAGRVVADPNASARVDAVRDGRIEPGETGFPRLGQAVKQGEVVSYLVPVLSSAEETELRQKLVDAERDLALLLPRSEHLGVVNPNMPMGDATVQLLQEMQIQSQALRRQTDLIKATLSARLPVAAPIAGVVSEVRLARGQVVSKGQSLVEIVDPARVLVEAFGFGDIPADLAGAMASAPDGRSFELAYLGRGPSLRQQAIGLLFAVKNGPTHAQIGLPVRVHASGGATRLGYRLPRNAVQHLPGGATIAWEAKGPESFAPRRISAEPLDADSVLATGELAEGMSVVSTGAVFLSQVR